MSGAFSSEKSFIAEKELDFPDEAFAIAIDEAVGAEDQPTELEELKEQGAVVDSNLVVFPAGTPTKVREAVCNWTLFAQRAATKQVDREESTKWVDAYLDVLLNTGWSVREEATTWHEESTAGSVVHQKILQLVAVALGPVPSALALVTAALTSLQAMNEKSKWITLFDRRAKRASSTGFSIANVEPESGGAAQLRSIDFRVEAHATMTQFLFFRFTSEKAQMFRRGVVLYISAEAIDELGPLINERVDSFASDNIAAYDM
jgi:hypothetical protein